MFGTLFRLGWFQFVGSFFLTVVMFPVLIWLSALIITNFDAIKLTAYSWQELIGSLIGAAAPLGIFLIQQRIQEKSQQEKRRREFLLTLEKNIVSAINNLADLDKMLHDFLQNTLTRFKTSVLRDKAAGRHSIGRAFIPLSSVYVFDKDFLKETTGSSFLENLIMDVANISQEVPLLLQDVSRQFDSTLTQNIQVGLLKLSDSNTHNDVLLANLTEFENVLMFQTLKINFPVYLRKLATALVAIRAMNKWGLKQWKTTFNYPPPFSIDVAEKMADYFKPDINKQIQNLQKDFKSKLLLVDESVPTLL